MNNGIEPDKRDRPRTIVDILKDRTVYLVRVAEQINQQVYLIQVNLFGKCKEDKQEEKELPCSTGILSAWDNAIKCALKELGEAQEDIEYMMEQFDINLKKK